MASDDLPLPLGPQKTLSWLRGTLRLTCRRLCWLAPFTVICVAASRRFREFRGFAFGRVLGGLEFCLAGCRSGARACPVYEVLQAATVSGVPATITRPPPAPPSGPRSMTQSAVLTTSRLCSTTSTVLP